MPASRARVVAVVAMVTAASALLPTIGSVDVRPAVAQASAGSAAPAGGSPVSACRSRPTDAVLATRIGATRALALRRLAAADSGRTDRFPESALVGATAWSRRSAGAWTAGFYPGSLWQAYGWTRDPRWLARARQWTAGMLGQATNTGTHDLGFMLDTNAGRGASMDPAAAARASYAGATLTAARSLATRWNDRVGLFQSGRYGGQWGVIVDSAMNAELLFHGARLSSDPVEAARLHTIGHQHLLSLVRDFVRADGGTRHRLVYDPGTGVLIGPSDGQGFATTSTWTRGQSWAIYGFTRGYRNTGDPTLLDAARRTADHWLARIGADCVPGWDFDAPGAMPFKDSSAGAIAAAGMLDLAESEPDAARADSYRDAALAMTAAITTGSYTTAGTTHPAILARQSQAIPLRPVEGSYSWGDHYLLEAITKSLRVLSVRPVMTLAAPTRVAYGSTGRGTVTATFPGGAPATGIPLTVQWRARGSSSWLPVARATSGRRGTAAFAFRPIGRGQLRVVNNAVGTGEARIEAATSAARTVAVSVRGRLKVARRYAGRYVLALSPVAAPRGTRFALQERLSGRWVTVRVIRSLPTTSTRQRWSRPRSFRVLPVLPAASSALAVVSSTMTLPRR